MVVLDTDYMTLLQWPEGVAARLIRQRLSELDPAEVVTTIISFEEQMRGWFDAIRNATEVRDQIEKYRFTKEALLQYCGIKILDFDAVAATEFQGLRKQYRRLGPMDLKIAAIVLAQRATLWTRNMKHFGRIKGLQAVDITKQERHA